MQGGIMLPTPWALFTVLIPDNKTYHDFVGTPTHRI